MGAPANMMTGRLLRGCISLPGADRFAEELIPSGGLEQMTK